MLLCQKLNLTSNEFFEKSNQLSKNKNIVNFELDRDSIRTIDDLKQIIHIRDSIHLIDINNSKFILCGSMQFVLASANVLICLFKIETNETLRNCKLTVYSEKVGFRDAVISNIMDLISSY